MKNSYIFFIIVWIPLVIYWILPSSIVDNNYKTVLSSINSDSKSPAGEIDKKFKLTQIVKFDKKLITDELFVYEDGPLCVDILMANYGDRRNVGDIEFIIKNKTLEESRKIDVSVIKDNTKHKICFNNIMLSNIADGQFTFIIKGRNSVLGKAVTAWLGTDISRGHVSINNKKLNKALIFSISRATSKYTSTTSYLLVLFALLSSIAFIYRKKYKYNDTIEIKNLDLKQTTIFKGMAIFMIAMHNYFHWIAPKPGENEFNFNFTRLENYIDILTNQTLFGLQATFSYFGHYGVQIFLFLSAYGLTKKYGDTSPQYLNFIWKRIVKIYPAFILAIISWAIFTGYKAGLYGPIEVLVAHAKALLYKLTFTSNFIPGEALNLVGPWWFVSLIVQFYLFFPLLLKIEKRFSTKGLITVALLSIISTPFLQQITSFNVYYTLIGHLAEFSLGIYLAKREKTHISFYFIILIILLFLLGNIFELFWYFSHMSVLLLMLLLFQWFIPKMNSHTFVFFSFLGTISMYIFYTNGFMRHAFAIAAFQSKDWFEIIQYGIGFFTTVILFSTFLYWLGKWLSRKISHVSQRNKK